MACDTDVLRRGNLLSRGACAGRFDQSLHHLSNLRQWFWLAQKSVRARVASFCFCFRRTIGCENHNAGVGIPLVDHLYNVNPIRTTCRAESQILNYDFVLSLLEEAF